MALRKNKSLVDQALDQAGGYVEALRPHVESAYEQAKDFVQDTAIPAIQDAGEKVGPALVDAREKAAPVLADARDKAAPVLADARAKAAPVIASGAALAGERATAARELAEAKVAELRGEQPKERSKVKTLVLLAVVAGGVAVVARRLQGGSNDNWQSSYTPKPAPAPAASGSGTGTPTSTSTDTAPATPAPTSVDPGGAAPGEAIADATEAPHPVSTPDDPAAVVDIDPDTTK